MSFTRGLVKGLPSTRPSARLGSPWLTDDGVFTVTWAGVRFGHTGPVRGTFRSSVTAERNIPQYRRGSIWNPSGRGFLTRLLPGCWCLRTPEQQRRAQTQPRRAVHAPGSPGADTPWGRSVPDATTALRQSPEREVLVAPGGATRKLDCRVEGKRRVHKVDALTGRGGAIPGVSPVRVSVTASLPWWGRLCYLVGVLVNLPALPFGPLGLCLSSLSRSVSTRCG